MGCIKQKNAFEHAQNVQIQIILHMCDVSFRHLLSIERNILHYPIILFVDCECPYQTVQMPRLIWAFSVRICSEDAFLAWHGSSNDCNVCIIWWGLIPLGLYCINTTYDQHINILVSVGYTCILCFQHKMRIFISSCACANLSWAFALHW